MTNATEHRLHSFEASLCFYMGGINSSSVLARSLRIQQSYHFCRHLILSLWQSAQLRLQSRRGLQEHGKRAVRKHVSPQPNRVIPKRMPSTPSVVSP